jgi:dTMP kinase
MMKGQFIVIEGLEGAGKSTAIKVIEDHLVSCGKQVVCTREPGGTPMAESIRQCVKSVWQETVTQETELLLMYASRSQLLNNVILPSLEQGKWVIGDRHDMSTLAYQGGGRQLNAQVIEPLRRIVLQDFEPDLIIYLDIEPETGLTRARGRGELDRIEQEDIAFFHRVRKRFLELVETSSHAHVVDAMQPITAVHAQLTAIINTFLANQ